MAENGPAKPRRSAAQRKDQFPMFDPSELARLAGRNMEVMTCAARACFNGATTLNREMVDFINARVKKDLESAQAVMTSKNSEEALNAHAAFVENAFRDYAEETSKVFHVAADVAKETLTLTEDKKQ